MLLMGLSSDMSEWLLGIRCDFRALISIFEVMIDGYRYQPLGTKWFPSSAFSIFRSWSEIIVLYLSIVAEYRKRSDRNDPVWISRPFFLLWFHLIRFESPGDRHRQQSFDCFCVALNFQNWLIELSSLSTACRFYSHRPAATSWSLGWRSNRWSFFFVAFLSLSLWTACDRMDGSIHLSSTKCWFIQVTRLYYPWIGTKRCFLLSFVARELLFLTSIDVARWNR